MTFYVIKMVMSEKYFNNHNCDGDLAVDPGNKIEIKSLEHADQLFEDGLISSEQHLEYKAQYYSELMKEKQAFQQSLGEVAIKGHDEERRAENKRTSFEQMSTSQLLDCLEYNRQKIVDLEKQEDKIFDQNDANPAFRGGEDPRIIDIRSQIAKLEAENKEIQEILNRR